MRFHQITRARTLSFALAAIGLIVVAASASAAADVVKYDTKLTIFEDQRHVFTTENGQRRVQHGFLHGSVRSEVRECMDGRRVVVFKRRDGADRKLGTSDSDFWDGRGHWAMPGTPGNRHVYAKVRVEVHDEFVCAVDRKNLRK